MRNILGTLGFNNWLCEQDGTQLGRIFKENSILQNQLYLTQFSLKKFEKIIGASSQYCLSVCKMTG